MVISDKLNILGIESTKEFGDKYKDLLFNLYLLNGNGGITVKAKYALDLTKDILTLDIDDNIAIYHIESYENFNSSPNIILISFVNKSFDNSIKHTQSNHEMEDLKVNSDSSSSSLPVGLEDKLGDRSEQLDIEKYLSPKEYFESLNLTKLPPDSARIIQEDILPDVNIGLLTMDNPKIKILVSLISDSYPEALTPTIDMEEPEIIENDPIVIGNLPKKPSKSDLVQKIEGFNIALEMMDTEIDSVKIEMLKAKIEGFEIALEMMDDDEFEVGGWVDFNSSENGLRVGSHVKFNKWDETRSGIISEDLGDNEYAVSTDIGTSLVETSQILSYKN